MKLPIPVNTYQQHSCCSEVIYKHCFCVGEFTNIEHWWLRNICYSWMFPLNRYYSYWAVTFYPKLSKSLTDAEEDLLVWNYKRKVSSYVFSLSSTTLYGTVWLARLGQKYEGLKMWLCFVRKHWTCIDWTTY